MSLEVVLRLIQWVPMKAVMNAKVTILKVSHSSPRVLKSKVDTALSR